MHRRHALLQAAALFGVSSLSSPAKPLPEDALLTRDPEKWWLRLRREQFLLPDWRAFLNNGSLGVAPRPVVDAVAQFLTQSAGLASDEYPRWGYETLDAHRAEMAEYLGCHADELAFTHNATEAMSMIANGLDLKAGDEVVITDQEHPSGRGPWLLKKARHGIGVRVVKLPLLAKNADEVADAVVSAIGPRTRVLSFSGILTSTGMVMPIRAICDAARAKNVLTVVDGAHMAGQVPVTIRDLNCDFLAGSPHKWLFAPAGSGFLYIRRDHLERLWPTIVTGNWDQTSLKAARFMMVGTNNRAVFEGMLAGKRFQSQVGPERVYARTHDLAKRARQRAAAVPYLELLTPEDDRLYAAMFAFRFRPGKDPAPFLAACRQKRVWLSYGDRLRLSTHIHTRPQDLDLFFGLMEETLGKA